MSQTLSAEQRVVLARDHVKVENLTALLNSFPGAVLISSPRNRT
jgi:hypothetical protein